MIENERQRETAMASLFLHHNFILKHDFQANKCKISKYFIFSCHQNIHYKCISRKICVTIIKCTKKILSIFKYKAKKLHIHSLSNDTYSLKIDNVSDYSKLIIGSSKGKSFPYDVLKCFIFSSSELPPSDAHLEFIDYTEKNDTTIYPSNKYICVKIPLLPLISNISIIKACEIACIHEINPQSCAPLKLLQLSAKKHKCGKCLTYYSVFGITKKIIETIKPTEPPKPPKLRMQKYHAKQKVLKDEENKNAGIFEDIPTPPTKSLIHKIISDAAQKMSVDNIEEAGCAVCGLLY